MKVAVEQKKSNIGNWIAYLLVRFFIFLSSILPRSWVYAFCKSMAALFFKMSKRREAITLDNIHKAFPELSDDEVRSLAEEVFGELSQTVAEILFMLSGHFDIDDVVINKEEALEKLSFLRKTHPGGWVVMTAHFSNWELAAHFLAKHGYPMLAVGREGDNVLIDQRITIPFRETYGNRSVYKKRAAIAILKRLKKEELVGVLIDQKVNEKEGVKVQFFNREVYTTSLIATMKEKLDITVVPIFLPRVAEGMYELQVGDPIEEKGGILSMTQAYTKAVEDVIRQYPSQWFWMHNRWKVWA